MLDWRNLPNYEFCHGLTAGQWAWEFLRRNPVYQQEWQSFIATWRALEATYGKPSQRDMARWKQDPRAWVAAEECPESDCRVDANKVLIECALGARWGFYKFPPDPEDDDPIGGGRLVWREISSSASLLEAGQNAPIELQQAALVFDLGLPLAPQLDQAKRHLQIEQRKRILSGDILPPRISEHAARLIVSLRILDGMAAAASLGDLAVAIEVSGCLLKAAINEAFALRDREYHRLLLLG
ncbi:MAG: DUF6499 domain-containing protein [Candidatus Thiodiazotropha sp.]|jgi:hypothetical protein